ncbi:hypothetical protein Tco_0332955 [Tanacetum coccineum]
MTRNLKLLTNFVEKFLETVKFGNDQIAPILGYGDLVQGTITIKRVYYVEGLNHNLFSVGQFCDADLEVAFRKSTCYIRDLKGNDLLIGSRGTDLYSISLQDSMISMDKSKITRKQSKASKHGHENQKEYKAEAKRVQSLSPFPFITSPRAILAFLGRKDKKDKSKQKQSKPDKKWKRQDKSEDGKSNLKAGSA